MTEAQQRAAIIEWSADFARRRRRLLLNTMKQYNVRVLVQNSLVCVYVGAMLVYCVGTIDSEHDIKIRDMLHCISSTIQALYRSGQLLEG